ncbi:MAG: succinyl-CoA synthetase subunit beta [Boseongicola sp.]|nr:succinyl-CoA synthetase subunit beta [Boseongicola sp.]MDD9976366.1 succinyl-CoA synthetase subunit beta [Boseongicola sp.]
MNLRAKISGLCIASAVVFTTVVVANARSPQTDADSAIAAFSANCFSPRLSRSKANEVFGLANVRYDFYDLDPFTSAAPTPASVRPATPGTDRRCEVSFAGDHTEIAVGAVTSQLELEGLREVVDLPGSHESLRTSSTALLAARRLNHLKIAVVHVGTRPFENGIETFLNVERLRSPR